MNIWNAVEGLAGLPGLKQLDGKKTVLGGLASLGLFAIQLYVPGIAGDVAHILEYFAVPLFNLGVLDKFRKLFVE